MPGGFLFDMDGTMVDSMPWHARSWEAFAREQRRAAARTGLLPPDDGPHRRRGDARSASAISPSRSSRALVARKEAIYRALFAPRVPRSARLPRLRRRGPRGGRQGRLRDCRRRRQHRVRARPPRPPRVSSTPSSARTTSPRGKPAPRPVSARGAADGRRPRRVPRVRGRAARHRGGAPGRHARRRDRDHAAGRRTRRARPRRSRGRSTSRRSIVGALLASLAAAHAERLHPGPPP